MRKLYEILKLLWIQKRIVAAATIWGSTVFELFARETNFEKKTVGDWEVWDRLTNITKTLTLFNTESIGEQTNFFPDIFWVCSEVPRSVKFGHFLKDKLDLKQKRGTNLGLLELMTNCSVLELKLMQLRLFSQLPLWLIWSIFTQQEFETNLNFWEKNQKK